MEIRVHQVLNAPNIVPVRAWGRVGIVCPLHGRISIDWGLPVRLLPAREHDHKLREVGSTRAHRVARLPPR